VKRVAILDFDVHHGNGTEAIVRNLRPSVRSVDCRGPWHSPGLSLSNQTSGLQLGLQRLEGSAVSYKPWADDEDAENVFFASTHGYGTCPDGGRMYPGSGETCGVRCEESKYRLFGLSLPEDPRKSLSSIPWNNASNHVLAVQNAWKYRCSPCTSGHLNGKFDSVWDGKIVNCGMTRKVRLQWRLNWAENILPALYKFNPDLIIISAGFDAHFQDEINHGFVSLVDDDFAWLTSRIVQLANDRCEGRVVSVLEGGYRVQGEITSPLARSVSAHVSALENTSSDEKWSPSSELAKWESSHLRSMIKESTVAPTLTSTNGVSSTSTSTSNGDASSARTSSKRRRRAAVDYTKLNEEMENERKKLKSDE
jgi:acetoin utilization deacetylase AcuC-like enzyme